MHLIKDLALRCFNIKAHDLRGKNFYKSIVDYRKKILPIHKHRIKPISEFVCTLCGSTQGQQFLEWEEGYALFQCRVCGAVSPNIELNNEKAHKESIYDVEAYREKFMRETHRQFDYRRYTFGKERYQYTVKRLNLSKDARVLDLGCGAGYFISVLSKKGIDYKGLEVTSHLVDYCQTYHQLNVEDTSLEDEPENHYDLVTMFDVLEHLVNPIETFKTVSAKLKPGGYCVAYTPNVHSIGYELMGAKQNTLLPFEHLCFFEKESINYLARKSGFVVEKIEYYGLDLIDYLLMKEYQDNIDYTESLSDMVEMLQGILDKYEISNHLRVTFKRR
jgi:2-polyprenyl-3-methyl-5-hydroxy-6-metoxy-1,4-benzoquinol methylase